MLGIIDYGVGNVGSIKNMLDKAGIDSYLAKDSQQIAEATRLILPGVGAFDSCIGKLKDSDLFGVIENQVIRLKVPILGLCVGMQMLLEGSEEGRLPGFGWIKGRNVRFDRSRLPQELKIPHMGWTEVEAVKPSRLLKGIIIPRFYFVHSYHAILEDEGAASMVAHHGYSFVAGVEEGNIMGIQFHPEKSHKFGMKLFANFIEKF